MKCFPFATSQASIFCPALTQPRFVWTYGASYEEHHRADTMIAAVILTGIVPFVFARPHCFSHISKQTSSVGNLDASAAFVIRVEIGLPTLGTMSVPGKSRWRSRLQMLHRDIHRFRSCIPLARALPRKKREKYSYIPTTRLNTFAASLYLNIARKFESLFRKRHSGECKGIGVNPEMFQGDEVLVSVEDAMVDGYSTDTKFLIRKLRKAEIFWEYSKAEDEKRNEAGILLLSWKFSNLSFIT